jgi:hypothetical protein
LRPRFAHETCDLPKITHLKRTELRPGGGRFIFDMAIIANHFCDSSFACGLTRVYIDVAAKSEADHEAFAIYARYRYWGGNHNSCNGTKLSVVCAIQHSRWQHMRLHQLRTMHGYDQRDWWLLQTKFPGRSLTSMAATLSSLNATSGWQRPLRAKTAPTTTKCAVARICKPPQPYAGIRKRWQHIDLIYS